MLKRRCLLQLQQAPAAQAAATPATQAAATPAVHATPASLPVVHIKSPETTPAAAQPVVRFFGDSSGKQEIFSVCLQALLASSKANTATVVCVVRGPYGCGKTHLLESIAKEAAKRQIAVLRHDDFRKDRHVCAARAAVLIDDAQYLDAESSLCVRRMVEGSQPAPAKRKRGSASVPSTTNRAHQPRLIVLAVHDTYSLSPHVAWIKCQPAKNVRAAALTTLLPFARATRLGCGCTDVGAGGVCRRASQKCCSNAELTRAARLCRGDLQQFQLLVASRAAGCAADPDSKDIFGTALNVVRGCRVASTSSEFRNSGVLGLVRASYAEVLDQRDLDSLQSIAECLSDADVLWAHHVDERLAGLGLRPVQVVQRSVGWAARASVLGAARRRRESVAIMTGARSQAFMAAVMQRQSRDALCAYWDLCLRRDPTSVRHRARLVCSAFAKFTHAQRQALVVEAELPSVQWMGEIVRALEQIGQ